MEQKVQIRKKKPTELTEQKLQSSRLNVGGQRRRLACTAGARERY